MISDEYIKTLTDDQLFDQAQEHLEDAYQLVLQARTRESVRRGIEQAARGEFVPDPRVPVGTQEGQIDEFVGLPEEFDFPVVRVVHFYPTDDGE